MFLAALLSGLLANTQLSVDPAAWRLHLCRNEIELMPVDLKVAGPLKVAVGGAVRCMVLAEKDYRLEPLEPGQLLDPKEQRLWLSIQAPSRPGVYKLEIRAGLEGAPGDPAWDKAQEGRSTVTIRVWPVELPAQNNFDFDPYYPGVFWLAGGHDPTEENIRRLEAHLRVLKFLRTTCCNWIAMPWELAKRAKIAGGKPLPQAAKERPGVYGVQEKPPLDFSDLDPFCRLPQKYGLTRIRAYFDHGPDWRIETLCETVSGRKYPAESKEARSIQVYLYSQLARYWKSRGFGEVYCKISDEIGPDWVDEYIRWGQVVREAGLRPYTTITSWLPFVPELLQKMNPVCDQWQVAV
ncbi:MAG: hypothetical protein H5T86_01550, partial [Armatimonadetes bacterium]|nr:hypothetical protein [Armatimonadota bacterium]